MSQHLSGAPDASLPLSSDPYRECFILVSRVLQQQRGPLAVQARQALIRARRTAVAEYNEILAIAQNLQDALLSGQRGA